MLGYNLTKMKNKLHEDLCISKTISRRLRDKCTRYNYLDTKWHQTDGILKYGSQDNNGVMVAKFNVNIVNDYNHIMRYDITIDEICYGVT